LCSRGALAAIGISSVNQLARPANNDDHWQRVRSDTAIRNENGAAGYRSDVDVVALAATTKDKYCR
jgi:hypothetical protein